jgi:hypothetical protein
MSLPTYVCTYTYVCMYVHICMYVRTHMYVCTYTYVCMYVHICMHVRTHMFVCTYTYVCMYVHICSECLVGQTIPEDVFPTRPNQCFVSVFLSVNPFAIGSVAYEDITTIANAFELRMKLCVKDSYISSYAE